MSKWPQVHQDRLNIEDVMDVDAFTLRSCTSRALSSSINAKISSRLRHRPTLGGLEIRTQKAPPICDWYVRWSLRRGYTGSVTWGLAGLEDVEQLRSSIVNVVSHMDLISPTTRSAWECHLRAVQTSYPGRTSRQ